MESELRNLYPWIFSEFFGNFFKSKISQSLWKFRPIFEIQLVDLDLKKLLSGRFFDNSSRLSRIFNWNTTIFRIFQINGISNRIIPESSTGALNRLNFWIGVPKYSISWIFSATFAKSKFLNHYENFVPFSKFKQTHCLGIWYI